MDAGEVWHFGLREAPLKNSSSQRISRGRPVASFDFVLLKCSAFSRFDQ
jgi:hypothetical protein